MRLSEAPAYLLLLAPLIVLAWGHHVLGKQQAPQGPEPATASLATSTPTAQELLPDLVPLPASDLMYEETADGSAFLLFSATYLNQGDGPLELIADPETAALRGDMQRNVFQRISAIDGTFRDVLAGTFLWHEEHLHYHFADFMEYDLRPAGATQADAATGTLIKSTFCVRDVSRVMMDLPNQAEEAEHTECWRARQGISVGWGDTYYYTYPDQSIDISAYPSGEYVLTLTVNPIDRLIEKQHGNNVSRVYFTLNREEGTITMHRSEPAAVPPVEHVHLDEPFGI